MKLLELLDGSAASDSFRHALHSFLRDGRSNERIAFRQTLPPVKVARTLTRMLESYSSLAIERVAIDAHSGCASFRGQLTFEAHGEEKRVRFDWDCKWKAIELGWSDYFGFPDQARAAREFDHDCFRDWVELPHSVTMNSR